jgi:hypothetical protein
MNPKTLRKEALQLWIKMNYGNRLSNNGSIVHTIHLDGKRLTTTDMNSIWAAANRSLGKVDFSTVKATVLYYSLQNKTI